MEKILPHLKELLLIPILILSIGWVASPLTNANESEIPEVTVPENNLSMEIHASLNGKPIEEKFYVLWLEIYNPEIYYPSDKEPLNDDERKIIDAIGPAKELLLTRSDWINLCKSSSSTLRILSVQCENLYERYTQTGPGEESGIGKECGETKGVPSEVCAAFSPFVDRSDEQSFKYWAPAHYNTHITTCSNSSCYFYDNIGTYYIGAWFYIPSLGKGIFAADEMQSIYGGLLYDDKHAIYEANLTEDKSTMKDVTPVTPVTPATFMESYLENMKDYLPIIIIQGFLLFITIWFWKKPMRTFVIFASATLLSLGLSLALGRGYDIENNVLLIAGTQLVFGLIFDQEEGLKKILKILIIIFLVNGGIFVFPVLFLLIYGGR